MHHAGDGVGKERQYFSVNLHLFNPLLDTQKERLLEARRTLDRQHELSLRAIPFLRYPFAAP